jgi:hypothetical protein
MERPLRVWTNSVLNAFAHCLLAGPRNSKFKMDPCLRKGDGEGKWSLPSRQICPVPDFKANAKGGPEGVSARKARIIEPRFIAVRFPWGAESHDA